VTEATKYLFDVVVPRFARRLEQVYNLLYYVYVCVCNFFFSSKDYKAIGISINIGRQLEAAGLLLLLLL
jgi:hypothetical protein